MLGYAIYGWLIIYVVIPGRTDIRQVNLVAPVCGFGHGDGERDRRNPNIPTLEPLLLCRPYIIKALLCRSNYLME